MFLYDIVLISFIVLVYLNISNETSCLVLTKVIFMVKYTQLTDLGIESVDTRFLFRLDFN